MVYLKTNGVFKMKPNEHDLILGRARFLMALLVLPVIACSGGTLPAQSSIRHDGSNGVAQRNDIAPTMAEAAEDSRAFTESNGSEDTLYIFDPRMSDEEVRRLLPRVKAIAHEATNHFAKQ